MNHKSGISRRQFLHRAGAVAGISALAPILSIVDSAFGAKTIRVGILLPSSEIYPEMGKNFLAGIQYCLQQKPEYNNIRLIIESTGYGPGSALRKARKLLEEDNVDLITGITGTEVSAGLRSLLDTHQKYLLANHIGANLIRHSDHSPFIIHNTMNYWQANWAMGRWATENIGKRAFITSSFYESGYDALHAFHAGFESAGGIVVGDYTDNLPAEAGHTNQLLRQIRSASPDLVFASYSGNEAVRFIRNYNRAGFRGNIPLLASGFTVDDAVLARVGKSALGIRSSMPWTGNEAIDNGSQFVREYKTANHRLPDSFALLGYETGQLISAVSGTVKDGVKNNHTLQSFFANAEISSPRGTLKVASGSSGTTSPVYLREVRSQGDIFRNYQIAELMTGAELEHSARQMAANQKTGWLNPYLCA